MKIKPDARGNAMRMAYRARDLRSGLVTISSLEDQLVLDLQALASARISGKKAAAGRHYIRFSIASLRRAIVTTRAALSDYIELSKSTGLSDEVFTRRVASKLKPVDQNFAAVIENMGNWRSYLGRVSEALARREERLAACTRQADSDSSPTQERTLGTYALGVMECLSEPGSEPGTTYKFVCLAWPWGTLLCAAVIVGTLVLTEGTAEGDDDGDVGDDFSEPGDYPLPDPNGDQPA